MNSIGKIIVLAGLFIVGVGLLVLFAEKLKFPIGRLPGDIYIKKEGFTFYFPITTGILISIIFTFILNFLKK